MTPFKSMLMIPSSDDETITAQTLRVLVVPFAVPEVRQQVDRACKHAIAFSRAVGLNRPNGTPLSRDCHRGLPRLGF